MQPPKAKREIKTCVVDKKRKKQIEDETRAFDDKHGEAVNVLETRISVLQTLVADLQAKRDELRAPKADLEKQLDATMAPDRKRKRIERDLEDESGVWAAIDG